MITNHPLEKVPFTQCSRTIRAILPLINWTGRYSVIPKSQQLTAIQCNGCNLYLLASLQYRELAAVVRSKCDLFTNSHRCGSFCSGILWNYIKTKGGRGKRPTNELMLFDVKCWHTALNWFIIGIFLSIFIKDVLLIRCDVEEYKNDSRISHYLPLQLHMMLRRRSILMMWLKRGRNVRCFPRNLNRLKNKLFLLLARGVEEKQSSCNYKSVTDFCIKFRNHVNFQQYWRHGWSRRKYVFLGT